MSAKNFTEEFKIEAVQQISEQGYPVSEVAARL
ncbi:transposase, partial [Yersinia entomophaga]